MKIEINKILPKFLEKTRFLLLLIALAGIIIDIFSFHHTPDWVVFLLIVTWLGTLYGWRLEANFSFFGSLIFLVIGQIAVIFQKVPVDYNSPAEKAALWIYIFFAIGLITRISEYKNPLVKKVRLLEILGLFDLKKRLGYIINEWSQNKPSLTKESISIGNKESEEYLELVKKWSRYKEISFLESISIGKKASRQYLELVKKWSSEERNRAVVAFGFTIGVLKLRTGDFFDYTKNYLNFKLKVAGFRIKERYLLAKSLLSVGVKVKKLELKSIFVLKWGLVKVIFVKAIKFIKPSLVLILKWAVNETKAFFDFSSSPVVIFLKSRFLVIRQTAIFQYFVTGLMDYPTLHLVILYLFVKKLLKEIKFYRWFFQDDYGFQLMSRILLRVFLLCLFFSFLAVMFYRFKSTIKVEALRIKFKKGLPGIVINFIILFFGLGTENGKPKETLRQHPENYQTEHGKWLFLIVFLLIMYWGENRIFYTQRDKFEFRPFINKVYYNIASKYSEVTVYGHNFRQLPFVGRVFINGSEQRVVKWDNERVVIEIDPLLSKTGDLTLMNDYGFEKNVKSNVAKFTFFDGESSVQADQKRFWDSLKELARIRSELYEENENF